MSKTVAAILSRSNNLSLAVVTSYNEGGDNNVKVFYEVSVYVLPQSFGREVLLTA
jgi:hypothetical protein